MPNKHHDPITAQNILSEDFTNQIDKIIQQILPAEATNHKLYKELFLTTIRIAQSERNHWETKLAKRALEEMEQAFTLLERFKHRRKVSVFGSARTPETDPLYIQAKELGQSLAAAGFMVITGAGGGIMAAAHEGAGKENALGFNIKLPFEQSANPTMQDNDALLTFHYFFIRKLFFVKESEAIILCPGGFGTLDEATEVMTLIQTGKTPLVPIILLETPESTYWKQSLKFFNEQLKDKHYILPSDMAIMRHTHSIEETQQEIQQFYANYHSSRWFKEVFAIRMKHPLNKTALEYLHKNYQDICTKETFTQENYQKSFREAKFEQLTYLLFYFTGKQYGRLRQLVDFINLPENWEQQPSLIS